ncbi:MAG: 6-carboxytetrahydropterin synthase [Verrucomicrobiota bacterium]|nr:6-carboxytetrahydropterin synthase [Verrucomicrobiota bacterium]
MIITKKFVFHAAHRLWNTSWTSEKNNEIYGRCCNLHGHSYRLTIFLEGRVDETGMVLNFNTLDAIVEDKILSRYDHSYLNELPEFETKVPTSENILKVIASSLESEISKYDEIILKELRLKETATSEAIIKLN